MNKSLMISIQPKHLVNILNGYKTLELRKNVPKDFKGWVNIYCTKGKKDILYKYKDKYYTQHYLTFTDCVEVLNGKVVARFWFNEYETIPYEVTLPRGYESYDGEWIDYSLYGYWVNNTTLERSCLTDEEISIYGKGKDIYAWHIKKLEIFDKPMELKNFHKLSVGKETSAYIRLDKAPQSWQYVYVK